MLVNRLIDQDRTECMTLIRDARADPQLREVHTMLVSGLAEAQADAVRNGALPGGPYEERQAGRVSACRSRVPPSPGLVGPGPLVRLLYRSSRPSVGSLIKARVARRLHPLTARLDWPSRRSVVPLIGRHSMDKHVMCQTAPTAWLS